MTWPALWPHGLLLLVLVPLIIAVLYTPLIYWDARSIWFYQGKLLFFNHGLYSGAYPPPFSPHPDYPKFIPVFSALTASLSGLWNEYLPKAALMVPLAAMWLGVAGLSLSLWAKLAVLAVMVLLPGALASRGLHGRLAGGVLRPGAPVLHRLRPDRSRAAAWPAPWFPCAA